MTGSDHRRASRGSRRRRLALLAGLGAAALGLAAYGAPRLKPDAQLPPEPPIAAHARTRIGINLFGLQTFNRQQVFTNLIAQSEWFSNQDQGWQPMPADQLDAKGWVRFLKPGQSAPRPLMLPPAPVRATLVECTYRGRGLFQTGGVAALRDQQPGRFTLDLAPTGAADEGGWIELMETAPGDPVRDIDCREADRPRGERFHPEFLAFVRGFGTLRFLDWQRTNDNLPVRWSERSAPDSASQVGPAGASVEDMVDLADLVGADPWFLMPYRADEDYIRAFAELVHQRIDPARTVYVELGNEVWNDMFDAARQARREGQALGLGGGDAARAQGLRYAQKLCVAMDIWARVFADRPGRLVRVAAGHNANPWLAEVILGDGRTPDCVDAFATAPYIWLDLDGMGVGDTDRVFAAMPAAIDEAMEFAGRNRAVAAKYGKRFIAYEGGQHLVTRDMDFANRLQRDPRMGDVYRRYLEAWDRRIRSDMTLYASTAPISEYGSWGLREYAGQPVDEAPKLAAVQKYMAAMR